MFTKFASMTAALALGAAAVTFTAQPAAAGAVDFFKCSLAEDKTMDDLVSVASHFHQVLADAGIEGYKASFLTPLYSSDIKRGVFYWVGHAPDVATIGAAFDFWLSDANKPVRDHWQAVTTGCESSSLHISTPVE